MNNPDWTTPAEFRKTMLEEALEHYIYCLKKDNCNQAAIDAFTQLLQEVENE